MIKNRFQTTMLADGGPPLFFSLMKPASHYGLKSKGQKIRIIQAFASLFKRKKKDVGGIMTGVSVRKVLTMFEKKAAFFFFFYLRRGRRAF